MSTDLLLSLNEARVLACLFEKSITTPQYYPMTQNGVMLAANQKNSRYPVMSLTEGDVGAALNTLEQQRLVQRDETRGRAVKWRQQFPHQLLLKPGIAAVLATLMLRGPQTIAEIRSNASALGGPAEADGVQAALDDLADRARPLVKQLPRAPGQAAVRFAHLLCGESAIPSVADAPAGASSASSGGGNATLVAQLVERIEALEARVAELERQLS